MRVKAVFICALVAAISGYFCAKAESQALSQRIAFSHKVRVSYYLVEGKNSSELKSSMLERGPIGYEHSRFFAYTLWYMKIGRSRRHSLAKIARRSDLLCDVSVQMPYWRDNRESSAEFTEYWEKFIASVAAHESRHVRYAVRSCRHFLKTKGTAAYLAVVSKRLKLRDESYDLKTGHGLLEGVSLPVE